MPGSKRRGWLREFKRIGASPPSLGGTMRLPCLLLFMGVAAHAFVIHGGPPASFGPPYSPYPRTKNASSNGKSETWVGAWMQAPTPQLFTSVSSQFQVMQPQLPRRANNHTTYIAAQWVGLSDQDGLASTGLGTIIQAGIVMRARSGVFTVGAWWQWFPDDEKEIVLPVTWGDILIITISITGPSTAYIAISNQTKNKSTRFSVADGLPAVLKYACFIIEDVDDAPFLHFADAEFDKCRAGVGGKQYGFDTSSGVVNMVAAGGEGPKASASIEGNDTVVVRYNSERGQPQLNR